MPRAASTAYRAHRIPTGQFRAIAAGRGTAADIQELVRTERSRRLVLLRTLLERVPAVPAAFGPLPDATAVWSALIRTERSSRGAVDGLLMHPQFGTWLAYGLRRLADPPAPRGGKPPLWVDLGYIHAALAVAAAEAGVPLRTAVPVRAGTVMLPRLGLAVLPAAEAWGSAAVEVGGGRIAITGGGPRVEIDQDGVACCDGGAWWWPLRRLTAQSTGLRISLLLDDIDPYRDLGAPVLPERLPTGTVEAWQRLLDEAWAILVGDDPEYAAALATGLRSLVPLPASPDFLTRSASSGDSFGALLVGQPPSGTEFAALLVHEFQHTKLGAYYHLLELFDDPGEQRFYAPWRDDPRPLSGLLQGVYAFLGVTGYWHQRRQDAAEDAALADFEFALWRRRTWRALRDLRADAGLTALGRRFAAHLADRMRPWWQEVVPAEVARLAGAVALDHRTGWRLRHQRPDPDEAATLVRRWTRAQPAAADLTLTSPLYPAPARWPVGRAWLARLAATDPAAFADLTGRPAGALPPQVCAADLLLATGHYAEAAGQYARLLDDTADPDLRASRWAGLLQAMAGADPPTRTLLRRPELAAAVHAALPAAQPPELVAWLSRR